MSLPSLTWDVSPLLVQSETLALRYYSVIVSLELLLGYFLLLGQLRRAGADDEEAGDFQMYLIPAALVGARLGHVVFYDLEHAIANPAWILQVWKGGMAGHGAVIGVLLASYWFAKRRALPWLEASDRLVYSVAAAAMLHPLGSLMNSETVGKPTDQSWGVRFPRYDAYLDPTLSPLRHPTQLYETALAVVVVLLLVACDRYWGREQRPRGLLTGVLLVALFLGRSLIGLWKEAEPNGLAVPLLDTGQLLSLSCAVVGAGVLWHSLRNKQRAGWIMGA